MDVRIGDRKHKPGRSVTCYYCNAVLRQNILREHMEQCPDVLLSCPNKCGVTVKRALLSNHLDQECVNKLRYLNEKRYLGNTKAQLQKNTKSSLPSEEALITNEKIAEEKNKDIQNLKLDIYGIGKDIGSLDQELQLLRSCIYDKQEQTSTWVQDQLNTIQDEIQLIRLSTEQQQEDQLHNEIAQQQRLQENFNSNKELLRFEIDRLLKTSRAEIEACRLQLIQEIHRIQEDLDEKYNSESNQIQHKLNSLTENNSKCQQKLKEFGQFLSEENVMISGVWKEAMDLVNKVSDRTDQMENKVQEFHSFLSDENVMISGVWMELKRTVESIEKRLGNLEEKTTTGHKEIAQLRQDVNDCIERQAAKYCATTTTNGHIIWKISNYEEKLDDAKKNETVLYSPVFYSSPFGYKLRVQVRLNGMGQWTGRHMTASLQVLEGEWDSILPSPFNQRVTLTLRDQCKSTDKALNLEKSLVEGKKKEEPAGLHVFIPHTILKQHNYIHNNAIFLEVTTQPHA